MQDCTPEEAELLKGIWNKLKDPGERRYRICNLFHCNDILFSRDLFVLDIINKNMDSIKPSDLDHYINEILSTVNNPRNSPTHGCRINQYINELEIFAYDESVGQSSIEQFIHSKRNSFILHNIALDIKDKYPHLWKTTRHSRPNLSINDIINNYNSFIIIDPKWYDLEVLSGILNLDKIITKCINLNILHSWFEKFTKSKEELYINWYCDIPMGVEEILESMKDKIDEEHKPRIFIKTVIIPMNVNSLDYYNYLMEDKSRRRFATLIYNTYGTLSGLQNLN